jgi:hypothetical protein
MTTTVDDLRKQWPDLVVVSPEVGFAKRARK